MRIIDKIGKSIINVLIVLIMIVAAFTLYSFIALEVMKKDYVSVLGYTYFEVASGSMAPTIEKNDMIIVKIGSDYEQEDIITYKLDGDFITHRVKRIDVNSIITKGDANNTKDSPVSKGSVLGRVVLIIPQAGIWKRVFMTPKVLILLMITFTLFSFTFSYNTKSKREKIKIQRERREKENDSEILHIDEEEQEIEDEAVLEKTEILFINMEDKIKNDSEILFIDEEKQEIEDEAVLENTEILFIDVEDKIKNDNADTKKDKVD